MSLHSWRSYDVARNKGAAAAQSKERWVMLMALSKRQLAEIAIHFASLCSEEGYDPTSDGTTKRFIEERDNLRNCGLI